MKGCFLLQRRFAYIGHDVALLLKERYGLTEFCGYVYLRSSYNFLKTQSAITYSDLLLDEEIHKRYQTEPLDLEYLRRLENEYGIPNLWPYLAVDRVMMSNQLVREYPYHTPPYSYDDMLRILQVKAKAIIVFLEKEKPDYLFFTQAMGGVGSLLLYHIAKKKGIPTWVICLTGMKDTYILSDDYAYFTSLDKGLAAASSAAYAAAGRFINEFRTKPQTYSLVHRLDTLKLRRFQQFSFLSPPNALCSIAWFIQLLRAHFFTDFRHDYSYIHPWNYVWDRLKRKSRNLLAVPYDEFNPADNYIFFPLHFEPEISVLLMAPWATDQLLVIKHLARSLPVGYKLYVKEHPQMVPYRPRSFYHELKKIPNVRLVRPTISSFDIIQNARLVTVIAGNAGWEATILKKPVITLGQIFFNRLSFVRHCSAHEELPTLVKELLENFSHLYNENELINFTAAILENAITHVDLLYLWEKEQDAGKKKANLIPLADALAKKIKALSPRPDAENVF